LRVAFLLAAAACIAAPVAAPAAESPAVVTLLEGETALLRGTARYALAEGVRLQSGDIIEVGEKGLAEIEFGDGTIVSLGPTSEFYAASIVARGAKGATSDFYLMQGWSKIASGKLATPFRITTPLFGFGTADATAVLQVSNSEAHIFVEVGEMRIADGFTKATPTSPVRLRANDFYTRRPEQKGVIAPRASQSFIAAMPKIYLDNLPSRVARYKDREVAPRRGDELTYADVEMWLKSPPEIRRPIMQRFIPKAEDPAFRQALIANLRYHLEWDRILFPEKYKPKPPPEPPIAKPTFETPLGAKPVSETQPLVKSVPELQSSPDPAATIRWQFEPPQTAPAPSQPNVPPVTVEGAGPERSPRSQ